MDEESIPRRDALLGLGTLVALLGLMVATIAYRIVIESANRNRLPRPAPAVSAESLATWRAYQRDHAVPLGPADAAAAESDVQAASHETAATPQSPAIVIPRFVAPGR